MTDFWKERRVVVTGSSGFLGGYVVDELTGLGCKDLFLPRSAEYDLREKDAVDRMYHDTQADVVIHLAATVGGIGANRKHPGIFFYDNAIMGIHLIEQGRNAGLEKFVCVGTVCSYPKFTPVPFTESDIWNGYPEETNAPYGLAKKMLMVQLQAYREEFGFKSVYVIPTNLYGPKDHFSDLEGSHVIPAIIRKCLDAKRAGDATIPAWGTGSATREFLYVADAAKAIVMAAQDCDEPDPINLGAGQEISIRDLVYLVRELTGFSGEVDWDTTKPDGQPRRMLDTSVAEQRFGWTAQTSLRAGLKETIDWFTGVYEPV